MRTETEVRQMVTSFYAEIKAIQAQPAFNTAARQAVEELTQRYMKGIAALEWALEPSELPEAQSPAACDPQMLEFLRQIAYPKRGTAEEYSTLQQFADAIQAAYTLEQLEAA